MAEVLRWSEEEVAREVELYHARVTAERASQRQDDDQTAEDARLMAADALAGSQGEGKLEQGAG